MKLTDICNINHRSISKEDNFETIQYLDTSNLTENVIGDVQEIELSKAPSRAQRKVSDKTILYSIVRPNLKHFGILNNPSQNFIVSTGFATLDIKQDVEVDPYYLYFFLSQQRIVDYLHTIGENAVSAYPTISPSDIGNLDINFPSLKEQQRVSSILRNIDQKIATNRQINHNLPMLDRSSIA